MSQPRMTYRATPDTGSHVTVTGDREVSVALEMIEPDLPAPRLPWSDRAKAAIRRNIPLALLVVLPGLAACLYFGALAADRYEVESRFIVRAPTGLAASQIASLVQGSSIIRSADDTYAVIAYMRSRDAVRDLGRALDLPALVSRPEADLFWRYPGLLMSASQEGFWRHVQRLIDVEFDQSTGIATLRVMGFRPEDAREIASVLLANAEKLINRLSERAQGDTVRTAEAEVERLRAEAFRRHEVITAFRKRVSMIDPARVSTATIETIARLSLEIAQANAQLIEIQRVAPNSNQIASLTTRIAALNEQIVRERRTLTGSDQSMAPRIAEYERLSLEREFAERAFASAMTQLEVTRLEAQRQRLFLERISQPVAPDYPKYPYRLRGIAVAILLAYCFYRIVMRLSRDITGHAEA